MTTFAQAAARHEFARIRLIRIEAIGEYAGQWTFCDRVPAYVTGPEASRYLPWFVKDQGPKQVPSEVHPFGGVEESGQITFTLIDGVGTHAGVERDALTARMRSDALPDLSLVTSMPATADSMDVVVEGPEAVLATIIDEFSVIYMGVEALAVDAISGSSGSRTLSVSRAHLGTDVQAHAAGSSVYLYPPFLEGRRVRLLYTYDDPNLSIGEETEVGVWRIEEPELDDSLGAWVFSALSNQGAIDRLLAAKAYRGTVARIAGASVETMVKLSLEPTVQATAEEALHFGDGVWLKHGDEIVFASQLALDHWRLDARGCVRTKQAAFSLDEDVRQVFCAYGGPVAGTTARSSFRYQARGAEAVGRSSGTWIGDETAEHPIPCILAALTSSATADGSDGLGGGNYTTGKGNYSALPMGVGAGIPAAEIDFDSFLAIWDRFPDWRATGLVLAESTSARDWCEVLARLFGFVLSMRAGKLRCDLATIPVADTQGVVSWGVGDILTEPTDHGIERSRIKVRLATDLAASTIKYLTTRPSGREHEIVLDDADFPLLAGHIRGFYKDAVQAVPIDAHAIWADSAGGSRTLMDRAQRLFFWMRRAPLELTVVTDISWVTLANVAEYVFVTHFDLPDRRTGRRSLENAVCWIQRRSTNEDANEVEWVLLALAAGGRYAKIAPAALVDSVSSSTATCHANRYTDPANGLGLATVDVAAFTVGDRVRRRLRSGVIPATTPSYQTVTAISAGANTLTLDGDFGGTLTAGDVLVYATYDDEVTAQKTAFASYADPAAGLGAAEADAFTYGER